MRPICAVSCARRARISARSTGELGVAVSPRSSACRFSTRAQPLRRAAVEFVDARLRALADHRRAADLREKHRQQVLAGHAVACREQRLEPRAVVQRLGTLGMLEQHARTAFARIAGPRRVRSPSLLWPAPALAGTHADAGGSRRPADPPPPSHPR